MIMFDFDGVLADSKAVCLAACRAAAGEQGAESVIGEDAFADLDPLTFEALAERHDLDPSTFAPSVARHVMGQEKPSQPFPGITEMISEIAGENDLAVISASHSSVIRGFLVAHGIDHHFSHVIGGDTEGNKTLKINKLKLLSQDTEHLFVGDAVSDMQSGRAAGLPVAAVTWGWQSRGRLVLQSPDFIAASPAELGQHITSLSKSADTL